MLRRIVLAAASCPLWFAPFTSPADAFEIERIPTERGDVPLYLPSEIEPGERLPLIVSLHGFTGNGTEHENYFRLRNQVDDRRFMLCVPQGTRNSDGARFWNATDFCCDYEFQRPDDSGYLRSLIERIASEKPIDLGSIHVTGHSNGGFMAFRMGCDHADLIASVASLAGATYDNPANCDPSEPVHVLQIHGTADDTIRYGGGCIIPFFFCYPGAQETIDIWSGYNRCSGVEGTLANLDLDGSIPGAETSRLLLTDGCDEQGSAELWTIAGGSHGPSFNGNYARELVDWLLINRRPDPQACVADFDDDDAVDGADLAFLLAAWGSDLKAADADGDGIVGGGDLSIVLAEWGPCP